MKIAIIGAGITGLNAAHRLSQKNHRVTVFEKENTAGGLASGFRRKNWHWSAEKYFHHLFASDLNAKHLIVELGLEPKLFYPRPKTSIFLKGQIAQFDSASSLLRFPYLSFPQKIRTGLITFLLKTTPLRPSFTNQTVSYWLPRLYGQTAFQTLWQPLLEGKFGIHADQVAMSWFWARLKKRSTRLGYLDGGFQILIDKLVEKIKENQGKIILNREIENLEELRSHFDKIIITIPTEKFFPTKLPKMLGAINLILVLKEKFLTDGTYWLNINEAGFPFVAVVEHTNFVDKKYYGGDHLLYVGGYYPQNHAYFKMTKEQIFKEFLPFLKKINPKINASCYYLNANLYAQPVIPVNYPKLIPQYKTPTPGVYLANMQMIFPWDRGINYAIELGERVANEVEKVF